MTLKITLALLLLPFINFVTNSGSTSSHRAILAQQACTTDSIPPVSKITDDQIDTLHGSFKNKTITIKLKSGDSAIYDISKWEYEYSQSLTGKIAKMSQLLDMTFTKAEQMPSFPGGENAWIKYVKDFCANNQELVKKRKGEQVIIQFIVNYDGEISNIHQVSNADAKLAEIGVRIIKESPYWVPAMQNGRNVVCLTRQLVKIDF